MSKKVIITADSTCDLSDELKEKYNIRTLPLHINFNETGYFDNVNIHPDEIFKIFHETKQLPKTAASSIIEYRDFLLPYIDEGYEVVHINIGSNLSSCYQNCQILSQEIPGIYAIDSCNLSSGSGHIVLEAAMRAQSGMPAKQIAEEIKSLIPKVHASFILDTLKFLAAGGRCSAVAALGANLLSLKPCIEVDQNNFGKMGVAKKYRGKLENVLKSYIDDQLAKYDNIRTDKVFITHSPMDEEIVKEIIKYVKSKKMFENIYETEASCTVACHCGPATLGILFMTE